MITERPYAVPSPRTFINWCDALGLKAVPEPTTSDQVLSFDDFCYYPGIKLYKVKHGDLYGFWRAHGDLWGECRTVEEWLEDFEWTLAEPEEEDLHDLQLFLGHDEFYNWSSGKVDYPSNSLWNDFKKLIIRIRKTNSDNG